MLVVSVRMRLSCSPARNVLSTTDPAESDFSFGRTNAPPLPGLTCWNSTIRHVWPSSSMCIPFRNWLVETTSATAREGSELKGQTPKGPDPRLPNFDEVLPEAGQHVDAVFADDRHVLDPHAADAGQVDAGLD